MSDPFIGEIRAFAMDYAPVGWARCEGQTLQAATYPELFRVLGNTYGGNGIDTFAVPDLRGRFAVGPSPQIGLSLGQKLGQAQVALAQREMPQHTHRLKAAAVATTGTPGPGVGLAALAGNAAAYKVVESTTVMGTQTMAPAGGDRSVHQGVRPHENRQPFLALNYCIALTGHPPGEAAAAGATRAAPAANPARRTR